MKTLKLAIAIIATLFASAVMAWDGAPVGVPGNVDVTFGTSYGYRVFFSPQVTMCTGGSTWAYLNNSDSNYATYVSVIQQSKVLGTTVQVYSLNVGVYCHIGYITAF